MTRSTIATKVIAQRSVLKAIAYCVIHMHMGLFRQLKSIYLIIFPSTFYVKLPLTDRRRQNE